MYCGLILDRLLPVQQSYIYRNLYENTDKLAVFSYKLRYIVGYGLVEMAISTNPKPTIYRNLYENTDCIISGIWIEMRVHRIMMHLERLQKKTEVYF